MAFLQAEGRIEPGEMARTFNCGIGMALIAPQENVKDVTETFERSGETVFEIGAIEAGERGCTVAGPADSWSSRDAWSASHHG
jgi:phosphoribosylformylglycinamidine cyclo-ligase